MSKFYNFDGEARYEYLRELAEKAGFPIIEVEEYTDVLPGEDTDYYPSYSGNYTIDTTKFVESNDPYRDLMCLDYVGSIIESALLGFTDSTASRKYSFGDTPHWWDVFAPDSTTGRKIIKIDVGVSY